MPQETENVEGLNPFSERRQAHPGSRTFRLEWFDTAVGSGEQHQVLNASTLAVFYEPGVSLQDAILATERERQFLGLVVKRGHADIKPVAGSLETLFHAASDLVLEDFGRVLWSVSHMDLRLSNIESRIIAELDRTIEQMRSAALAENWIVVSEDSVPASARAALTGRPIGPVQFFEKLLEAWGLDEQDGATLLGFEKTSLLQDLLRGTVSLRGRDTKDRLAYLLDIDFSLNALFRDEESIRAWLRHPLEELGGETPLDHLLKGSMENLLRLKQLLEFLSGR